MQAKDDYEKVAQAQARGVKKGNVKKMEFMLIEEGEEIPVTSPRSLQRYDSMNAKVGNDVVVQEDQDKETMTRMSSILSSSTGRD